MSALDRLSSCVRAVAALLALAAAIDLFLPEGEGKRGVEFLLRLTVTLALAAALADLIGKY